MTVTDYGLGFEAGTPSRTGHFGIDGMRERCRNLGGNPQDQFRAQCVDHRVRAPALANAASASGVTFLHGA